MNVAAHAAGFRRWLRLARRHGRPERVLYFDGGIGDQLLMSTVARELQRRRPTALWFFTNAVELFEGNSDFTHVQPMDLWLIPWLKLTGSRVERLSYQDHIGEEGRDAPLAEHLIASLCRRAGVSGEVTLRPWLPAIAGTRPVVRARPLVAVQSSCLSGRYPMENKQWPVDRMAAVVGALRGEVDFEQVGATTDPLLDGCADHRGGSLTATARRIAGSDLFLGLVGFTMHAARAVECPSVIVYGGREPPRVTGYACNWNIASTPPCSPCWYYSRCDFGRRCLTEIAVATVVEAVRRALDRRAARPLPVEVAQIAA